MEGGFPRSDVAAAGDFDDATAAFCTRNGSIAPTGRAGVVRTSFESRGLLADIELSPPPSVARLFDDFLAGASVVSSAPLFSSLLARRESASDPGLSLDRASSADWKAALSSSMDTPFPAGCLFPGIIEGCIDSKL